jgi:hypothetical protein
MSVHSGTLPGFECSRLYVLPHVSPLAWILVGAAYGGSILRGDENSRAALEIESMVCGFVARLTGEFSAACFWLVGRWSRAPCDQGVKSRWTAPPEKSEKPRALSRGFYSVSFESIIKMCFINGVVKFVWLVMGVFLFVASDCIVVAADVTAGKTVILTVASDGTAPFAYKWQKGGVEISGQTAEEITLTNVQISDSGSFPPDTK